MPFARESRWHNMDYFSFITSTFTVTPQGFEPWSTD